MLAGVRHKQVSAKGAVSICLVSSISAAWSMKTLMATVVNAQDEPDNGYHMTITVDVPDTVVHVSFAKPLATLMHQEFQT
jgi:hypothetical protein